MSTKLERIVVEIEQTFDQWDLGRVKAGRLLLQARELVESGEAGDNVTWRDWCSAHISRSLGDIRKIMRIARQPDPMAALRAERESARERMTQARERSRACKGNSDKTSRQSVGPTPETAPEIAASALSLMPHGSRAQLLIEQIISMSEAVPLIWGEMIEHLDDGHVDALLNALRQRWPNKFNDSDGPIRVAVRVQKRYPDFEASLAWHERSENQVNTVEPDIINAPSVRPSIAEQLGQRPKSASIVESRHPPEIAEPAAGISGPESKIPALIVEPALEPKPIAAVDPITKVQALYDATTGEARSAAHEFMVSGYYIVSRKGRLPGDLLPFQRAFGHALTPEQRNEFRIRNTEPRRAAA